MRVVIFPVGLSTRVLSPAIFLVAALGLCCASLASSHEAEGETEATHEDTAPESTVQGVALGEYQIRSYYPVEAQKSTVHFVLYASVQNERFAAVQRFVDEHEHKVRDQVITATRLTPLAEYDEADLAAFRRRILMRLRRMLRELIIDDVYVTDFTLIVKSL